MGYLKVYCSSCGGTYDIYKRNLKDPASAICPHCDKRMYRTTFEALHNAFDSMEKANLAIAQDAVEHHLPLFTVDYVNDSIYENAKLSGKINEL